MFASLKAQHVVGISRLRLDLDQSQILWFRKSDFLSADFALGPDIYHSQVEGVVVDPLVGQIDRRAADCATFLGHAAPRQTRTFRVGDFRVKIDDVHVAVVLVPTLDG